MQLFYKPRQNAFRKKRGSLRRPKLACSRRALTFLHVHKAPELPTTLVTRILDFDPTPLP